MRSLDIVSGESEVRTERLAQQAASGTLLPFQTGTTAQSELRGTDIIIQDSGTEIARRAILNFQDGTNTTAVVSDDPANSRVLVTYNAAGAATTTEPFVTIGNTAGLSAERALTGTTNQVVVTDNGAGGTVVLSAPQNLHTGANPTFAGVVFSTAGRLSLRVTTPAQIVANTNDYNPGTGSFFRITTDASRNITGIVAGADGDMIYFRNAGSFDFVLTNLDAGSTAANQIITGTGASVAYTPNETAALIYDITSQRWVLIV